MQRYHKYAVTRGDRYSSFLLAFCLHGILVLAALFWPSVYTPPVDPDFTVLNLDQITIGAADGPEGGVVDPVPAPPAASRPEVAKPETPPEPVTPPQPETPPVPVVEPVKPVETKPETPPKPEEQAVPIEEPVKVEPEVKPEAKPEVKPEVKPEAKPEVKPEVKPEAEPEVKPEVKPEAKPEVKPEAKPEVKPTPKPLSDEEVLRRALAQAGAASETPGKTVTGAGGDGVGLAGLYRDSVISRIRPFFVTRPRTDYKVFSLDVQLDISDDGTITNAVIIRNSGDGTFDSNVLRAIKDAGKMEPPPAPQYKRMTIQFTSDMAMR